MNWLVEPSFKGLIIPLYEYRHIGCGARKADEIRPAQGPANFSGQTAS